MDRAEELRRRYPGPVLTDEPMSRYTNYRLGGPADFLIIATSIDEIIRAVNVADEIQMPWIVLGNATNILVADAGVRGLVVLNQARHYELKPSPDGNGAQTLIGEAGVLIAPLAKETVALGLQGLHYAVGIPGSLGGAVVSNAGGHGHSFSEVLRSARVLCDGKDDRVLGLDEIALSYRSSSFKDRQRPRDVILSVEIELQQAPDRKALDDEVQAIIDRRAARLPTEPSAGSTFKNPPGHLVAELIEKAGLKGTRIGGAQISPKHANFLVNDRGGRAEDVRKLIEIAREEVHRQFGITLQLEVELLGDWDGDGNRGVG